MNLKSTPNLRKSVCHPQFRLCQGSGCSRYHLRLRKNVTCFLDGWCETSSHVSHVRMDETSSKHLQTLARIHHSWCLKSWPVFNINIFKMMLKKTLGSMRLKKYQSIQSICWLVVDLPLWKIWKSVGMIIPNIYTYIYIWRFPIKTGGWAYPPEKWWSSSDWIIIPTDGKIKFMFQTTNQYWIISIISIQWRLSPPSPSCFDPRWSSQGPGATQWTYVRLFLDEPLEKKDSKWEWQNSNPVTKWFWKNWKLDLLLFPINSVWWPNRYGFEPWVRPDSPPPTTSATAPEKAVGRFFQKLRMCCGQTTNDPTWPLNSASWHGIDEDPWGKMKKLDTKWHSPLLLLLS